jgi:hypothetical protein
LLNLRIKAHDYDTTHDTYENGANDDDDNDIVIIIIITTSITTNYNNNNNDNKNKWPRVSRILLINFNCNSYKTLLMPPLIFHYMLVTGILL